MPLSEAFVFIRPSPNELKGNSVKIVFGILNSIQVFVLEIGKKKNRSDA